MIAKILRTPEDHAAAMLRVEELLSLGMAEEENEELDLLLLLVHDYEERHFPIAPPDPIEAIKFRAEQQGLSLSDIAPIFGGEGELNAVLEKRVPLSLTMVRKLHDQLGISADLLLPATTLPGDLRRSA